MNKPSDPAKLSDAKLFLESSRILRKWYTKNGNSSHEKDVPFIQEAQHRLMRLIHELSGERPSARAVRIARSAFAVLILGNEYSRSKMLEIFARMCFFANIVLKNKLDDESRKHVADFQQFCILFRDVLEVDEAEHK